MVPFIVLALLGLAQADYNCLCNYNVEKSVYPVPNENQAVIGYMYEFDCKATLSSQQSAPTGWTTVAFEHQVGYIHVDGQTEDQICSGDPPNEDKVTTNHPPATKPPTTIQTQTTTTLKPSTTTVTTTTSTTTTTTTQPTTTSTTQSTTVTTTPIPTTVTTTPRPTTTSSTTTTSTTSTTTTPQPATSTTTIRPSTMAATTSTSAPTSISGPLVCPDMVVESLKVDGGVAFIDNDLRKCFELISSKHSWSYAESLCKSNGGHLATINSIRINELIHNFIQSNGRPVWIGLTNKNQQQYVWSSGEPLTYQNWQTNHGTNECVAMDDGTGTWEDHSCSMYFASICEYDAVIFHTKLSTLSTTVATNGHRVTTTSSMNYNTDGNIHLCPLSVQSSANGNWLYDGNPVGQFGDACYEFIDQRVTWNHGESICLQNGGHLAYIENANEQTYLQAFMKRHNPDHAVWIGLNDVNREGIYKWSSGKPVSYTNWLPGHDTNNGVFGSEDCVMFVPYKNGIWDDVECGSNFFFIETGETHPIVCQYKTITHPSGTLIG